MKADRLVSIPLILQTGRKVTAQELAERLEGSERTIYRDLDGLSAAGVPVYAERGPGGGCRTYLDLAGKSRCFHQRSYGVRCAMWPLKSLRYTAKNKS